MIPAAVVLRITQIATVNSTYTTTTTTQPVRFNDLLRIKIMQRMRMLCNSLSIHHHRRRRRRGDYQHNN